MSECVKYTGYLACKCTYTHKQQQKESTIPFIYTISFIYYLLTETSTCWFDEDISKLFY